MAEPSTERGRETRQRILHASARLFHERGVNATSVDDVLTAAAAGKGQFYRYFRSKDELIAAVVGHQLEHQLAWQRERLEQLDGWKDLESYLSEIVGAHRDRHFVGGCPIGSLAAELDRDERVRGQLAEALAGWQSSFATGIRRLVDAGCLREDVRPDRLAATSLAVIQGAYLLSTAHRKEDVMAEALEETLTYLRSYAPEGTERRARDGTV